MLLDHVVQDILLLSMTPYLSNEDAQLEWEINSKIVCFFPGEIVIGLTEFPEVL